MRRIIIWEEDDQERDVLTALLEDEYRIVAIHEETAFKELLRKGTCDVILLGIPEGTTDKSLRVLRNLRVTAPKTPILCRLPYGDPGVPTMLLRQGVSACISRDCTKEELKSWLREVRVPPTKFFSVSEPFPPFESASTIRSPPMLLGESEAIKTIQSQIALFARFNFPVLLVGECGTGKELASRAIHYASKRSPFPFIPVNCGAIPDSIIEGELFGTEKGAYTGAVTRPGNFELANRGTLFLDEITELSPSAQAKLLRALEDGEVRRLGSQKSVHCDVRILSATNANLETSSGFRYDLLERLETLVLELPPLRNHLEDVPILSRHFLEQFSLNATVGENALEKLMGYDWPGNIRQLRNTIVRAAVTVIGDSPEKPRVIEPEHIVFGRRPADG